MQMSSTENKRGKCRGGDTEMASLTNFHVQKFRTRMLFTYGTIGNLQQFDKQRLSLRVPVTTKRPQL